MLAQTNDVEYPINCWKCRLLIPAPPFPRNLCLHREWEKYICWHCDQSPQTDMTTSVRKIFSARGDQGSLSQRKQPNPKRWMRRSPHKVSSLRLLLFGVWFWIKYPNTTWDLIKMYWCLRGELSCRSANDIQWEEKYYWDKKEKKKIQIQTSLYITDTSDRQWNRTKGTIGLKMENYPKSNPWFIEYEAGGEKDMQKWYILLYRRCNFISYIIFLDFM